MSYLARTIGFYAITLNPVSILPTTFVGLAIIKFELTITMFDTIVKLSHVFTFSIKRLKDTISMH